MEESRVCKINWHPFSALLALMLMNTRLRISLGKFGEDAACAYLEANEFVILRRNFRCHRYGEVDIIAGKAGVISFIEVKTRTSTRYGVPVEAVTLMKQRKIHRCAEYYLQLEGYMNHMPIVSFDVISIIVKGDAVERLEYFPHCF